MYFDNDKYYSLVKISDDELELHDNMKYAVGETVLLAPEFLRWDPRLYHPGNSLQVLTSECYVVFDKTQNKRVSPTQKNLYLRNHLYSVVKVDDPKVIYSDLTIEKIRKLENK